MHLISSAVVSTHQVHVVTLFFSILTIWAASWENQLFAYAKTKAQISFAVTTKLISGFVFAIQIVQSLYFLNTKSQASCHLLWLYSPVCVGPGRKPRRPVFSQQGSYDLADIAGNNWAVAWQNKPNGLCSQRRFRSYWASAQRKSQSLPTLLVHSEGLDLTRWVCGLISHSLENLSLIILQILSYSSPSVE